MLHKLYALTICHFKMILRDRLLHAVFAVAIVLLLLVPTLSGFSMRQVQELAITLSLSTSSLVLLVTVLLLGSSAVWRDVERRYTAAILPLPVQRTTYLLAKFVACSLFLGLCALILGVAASCVIPIAASQYPADLPIAWGNIVLAISTDLLKYILLLAFAILLSTVSTSFALPFFGSLAIYLAGSASQEVFEYLSGEAGQQMNPGFINLVKGLYFFLPNFSGYDFKVHAVYNLPVTADAIVYPIIYTLTYSGIVLGVAVWAFNRRQLP